MFPEILRCAQSSPEKPNGRVLARKDVKGYSNLDTLARFHLTLVLSGNVQEYSRAEEPVSKHVSRHLFCEQAGSSQEIGASVSPQTGLRIFHKLVES